MEICSEHVYQGIINSRSIVPAQKLSCACDDSLTTPIYMSSIDTVEPLRGFGPLQRVYVFTDT